MRRDLLVHDGAHTRNGAKLELQDVDQTNEDASVVFYDGEMAESADLHALEALQNSEFCGCKIRV